MVMIRSILQYAITIDIKNLRHPTVQRKLELVHERFNSVMLKVINGCYGNEFIYICMEGLLGQTEKAEPFEVMA